MTMVEALAAGTPVIGLDRGGERDIVRPDVDGVLVERPELGLVRDAVEHVATAKWRRDQLTARAREFSRARFIERFTEHLVALGATAV